MYDEIKKYLQRYYYLSLKVDSLQRELNALEALANGTQGCSFDSPRVQKSRNLEAPFIKYIDKIDKARTRLDEKISELLKLKEEIQNVISQIDDPLSELVLTYRYINLMDWNDIADKMHYALSYVFKLHRQGLSSIDLKSIVNDSKT